MESTTDAAEWSLEVERVLPQLKVTIRTDNKVPERAQLLQETTSLGAFRLRTPTILRMGQEGRWVSIQQAGL